MASTTNNENEVSVKISHGNEIRRVTLPQATYNSLLEHTATLFGLDAKNCVLKYEDDDGDKISMSSDMEFREALRLSKTTQKILRLFVDLKVAPKPDAPEQATRKAEEVYLGPQGGLGSPSRAPPPHFPRHHPAHHSPHPHPHPHPPFHHAPPGFGYGGPWGHMAAYQQQQQQAPSAPPPTNPAPSAATPSAPAATPMDPSAQTYPQPFPASTYSNTSMNSSAFSPVSGGAGGQQADRGAYYGPQHYRRHLSHSYYGSPSSPGSYTTHTNTSGVWGANPTNFYDRKADKESWRTMKDQWKAMKREASTDEDKRKIKELRHEWKSDMKHERKAAVQNMKAMRLCDKSDRKVKYVARHVADVTVPDGTVLPPNTPFVKTWKLRNEGPAWPVGSQLMFISQRGDHINGPERVLVKGEVLTGSEVEVSIQLITPGEPGRYVGYYRMVTPEGVKFGQRVWVSFVVEGSASIVCANVSNNNATMLVDEEFL